MRRATSTVKPIVRSHAAFKPQQRTSGVHKQIGLLLMLLPVAFSAAPRASMTPRHRLALATIGSLCVVVRETSIGVKADIYGPIVFLSATSTFAARGRQRQCSGPRWSRVRAARLPPAAPCLPITKQQCTCAGDSTVQYSGAWHVLRLQHRSVIASGLAPPLIARRSVQCALVDGAARFYSLPPACCVNIAFERRTVFVALCALRRRARARCTRAAHSAGAIWQRSPTRRPSPALRSRADLFESSFVQ
jgi:hypothetical protein